MVEVEVERALFRVFNLQTEAGQIVLDFHHAGELLEILACGGALDAEQFLDGLGRQRIVGRPPEFGDDAFRRLEVVSHQKRAMIPDFPMNKGSRQRQAGGLVARESELFHPQKHVLQRMPPRDAVKPAAHREISDRHFLFAERLDGLRGDLDIAEQRHVRHIAHSHFVDAFVFVLDCEDFVLATDAIPGRVQIERARVVPRGNQPADGDF